MSAARGPGAVLATESVQRRVLALLFADLVGYTTLCEKWDPEQVHLLVRPAMTALRRVCELRGGVVPSIEGDGFLAVFGTEGSGEDAPGQAFAAAIELQHAVEARRAVLPELPGLKVALHAGEVVLATSSAGLALSGDAVNVASRVCGLAGAGELLATREMTELVQVDSGWSDPREVRLRGREAPVTVHSYGWQGSGEGALGPRWSALSPYVTRPALEEALAAALVPGAGVVVFGAAGMGKTRLVHHGLARRRVLSVSCSAPLHPTARDLLADLLEQVDGARPELVGLLRGAPSQGMTDQVLLYRAAGRQLARREPGAVVLVDDAELMDGEQVGELSDALSASGLAWVMVSRHPLAAASATEVFVPPWSPLEAEALLALSLPQASDELRHAVLSRAGDCPLFLEHCVRLLLDNGAVQLDDQGARLVAPELLGEVPTSMRMFVESRLDLLTEAQREVLGIAAVLGAEPELALLETLAGEHSPLVEQLVDQGFLRWTRGTARQPVLHFSHALVRDVTYQTQLRSRRVEIHRAASEWYAVLPVAQVLESQAYHLEQAVRLAAPDCELLTRAVEAMVLYAQSIEQERTRRSREVLARAKELVDLRPDCAVDLLRWELAWASVNVTAFDEAVAEASARRALELARERKDVAAGAWAHLQLGRAAGIADEQSAQQHFEAALHAFQQLDDPAGEARVEIERGALSMVHEGAVRYVDCLERAHGLALRSGDVRLQATCAQQLALHHAVATGRPGFALWSQSARATSRADDVGLQPRLDLATGILAMFGLAPAQGTQEIRRALVVGRELGLGHVLLNAAVVASDLALLAGDLGGAARVLAEAEPLAAARPLPWIRLQLELLQARLRQRQGRQDDAAALLQGVSEHALAGRSVLARDLAEARAWCALERGRFGEARALAQQAVGIDEESGELCAPLRPRLVELVATVASGETVALGTIAALRSQCRETGLETPMELARRFLLVEDLTRGWSVDLHGLQPCDVVEARALDLEIEALSARTFHRLLDAATVWGELGVTVWQARALLWHTELTGAEHAEAQQLLDALQAPAGLAHDLRAQVRGLAG